MPRGARLVVIGITHVHRDNHSQIDEERHHRSEKRHHHQPAETGPPGLLEHAELGDEARRSTESPPFPAAGPSVPARGTAGACRVPSSATAPSRPSWARSLRPPPRRPRPVGRRRPPGRTRRPPVPLRPATTPVRMNPAWATPEYARRRRRSSWTTPRNEPISIEATAIAGDDDRPGRRKVAETRRQEPNQGGEASHLGGGRHESDHPGRGPLIHVRSPGMERGRRDLERQPDDRQGQAGQQDGGAQDDVRRRETLAARTGAVNRFRQTATPPRR